MAIASIVQFMRLVAAEVTPIAVRRVRVGRKSGGGPVAAFLLALCWFEGLEWSWWMQCLLRRVLVAVGVQSAHPWVSPRLKEPSRQGAVPKVRHGQDAEHWPGRKGVARCWFEGHEWSWWMVRGRSGLLRRLPRKGPALVV